ncbi:hypothetical protein GIB67_000943 [Kingdonia uniflora]|uniref:Protein TILLER ANGLE CONTROL 1 n=1 Tax=Kingdonia uniflora TaxID=39325 RepID=A0A7J7MFZ0_9MAGN|nr:hypothetical protein GIB67_000943 [Kingdonia uniflora]
MNIFNWVHRRFNQNADGYTLRKKDKLSRGDEINKEVITNDADTEALLVNGWNDGILSIGTFGFDPLKPANIECEEIPEEKKDVAMSTDPLVQNVSVKQEVVKVSCFNPSANVVKCDPIRLVKKILTKKIHPAHEANIRASGSLFAANITNTTLADGCKYGFNTEKSIGELNCLL